MNVDQIKIGGLYESVNSDLVVEVRAIGENVIVTDHEMTFLKGSFAERFEPEKNQSFWMTL